MSRKDDNCVRLKHLKQQAAGQVGLFEAAGLTLHRMSLGPVCCLESQPLLINTQGVPCHQLLEQNGKAWGL